MENIKDSKSNVLLENFSKILKDVSLINNNEINEKKNAIINKKEIIKNEKEY